MSRPISPPLLETVARRACVINSLLKESADKRELETVLDVSRTTVNRAISSLTEAGCIVHRDGKWEVTLFGRLAYQEYEQLVARYESISGAQPLLRYLPTETLLDVNLLANADILLSEQPAPHAPITRLGELLQHSRQVIGLSPVVLPKYVQLFYQQIVERGTDTDLLLGGDLVEYLWATYTDEMDAMLGAENGTVWWLKQLPPFGFVLIDEEVLWVAIYGEKGGLKGAIISDTDAAVTWATDMLQAYRQQGEQILIRGEYPISISD